MPTTTAGQDLDTHYKLSDAQIQQFREQGFVKLKNVLSAETLEHYGKEITAQVIKLNTLTKPMSERTTYERAFLQIMNLWTKSPIVKEFAFGKRLARVAAELMGTNGVRMYHDQALYKEPGGGITPWHADQYYWPFSSSQTCTVWIPLQAVPHDMGPLAFAVKSHKFESGRDLEISDESEAKLQALLQAQNFEYFEQPFDLGECSFHWGWTYHRAGANTSQKCRSVMTMIYMDDEIRIAKPRNKNQIADHEAWLQNSPIGEVPGSALNPVLYRA